MNPLKMSAAGDGRHRRDTGQVGRRDPGAGDDDLGDLGAPGGGRRGGRSLGGGQAQEGRSADH